MLSSRVSSSTQGLNLHHLYLLHWQGRFFITSTPKPKNWKALLELNWEAITGVCIHAIDGPPQLGLLPEAATWMPCLEIATYIYSVRLHQGTQSVSNYKPNRCGPGVSKPWKPLGLAVALFLCLLRKWGSTFIPLNVLSFSFAYFCILLTFASGERKSSKKIESSSVCFLLLNRKIMR